MAFERIGGETVYEGKIATVRRDTFRFDDGEEAKREIVEHPGAVGVVAHDGETLYLVKQPREAVNEPALLELPAGKLDRPGEDPRECARRELAEEVGRAAGSWRDLGGFYTAPAILTEFIHCFLATDLSPVDATPGEEDEAIETVRWPLAELAAAIDEVRDAKTLIGLLRLERLRR